MNGQVVIVLTPAQADALLPTGPVNPCRLCGNRSPAHYCPPEVDAQDELERQIRLALRRPQ